MVSHHCSVKWMCTSAMDMYLCHALPCTACLHEGFLAPWLRCPNGGQVGLKGCNLLGYDLPETYFPKGTVTSVQMVGGTGGNPGYVSRCNSNGLVSATTISIYTDKEASFIDQIPIRWSDGTYDMCVGAHHLVVLDCLIGVTSGCDCWLGVTKFMILHGVAQGPGSPAR